MQERNCSGILIIDKPAGVTSHDMVGLCRKLYGTRKVGHAGTLDPMATGVLVMLIGRAAKASDFLLEKTKVYSATLRLGIATDTQDSSGKITASGDVAVTRADLEGILPRFRGDILQIPPMYSALKRDGQKLYDLARQGIEIEREARPITVHRLELCDYREGDSTLPARIGEEAAELIGLPEADLTVVCSKGTYIRTLCHDIGEHLGCYGTMSALRRTRAGMFDLSAAISPDALRTLSQEERDALLLPIEEAFYDLPKVVLSPFFARLAHCGQQIYLKKIGLNLSEGAMVRFYDPDAQGGAFFALGQVSAYPDGLAIKPIKQFSE